ncbi:pre-rRNA-processing protein Tsr2p [Trichomonascus vanleenenianus]|uniref:Tsr2p n=1 Tax=Trichomonascus vanleenenianus TaxID=2268995 RepID=UPI003EC9B884
MDVFELEIDAPNVLLFKDEKKQSQLELGVCMAIFNWDTLNTAIESNWGGPDGADKREWMVGEVIDLFDTNYIDAAYIEEFLLNIMADEFETTLEDGTAAEVAQLIINLYKEIAEGDTSQVKKLHEQYLEKSERRKNQSSKVKVQSEEGDDDSSSEEEGDADVEMDDTPPPSSKPEPVIDDDGFELVQRKRR